VSCSGAPQNATCTVTPATFNLSTGGSAKFSVVVATSAPQSAAHLSLSGARLRRPRDRIPALASAPEANRQRRAMLQPVHHRCLPGSCAQWLWWREHDHAEHPCAAHHPGWNLPAYGHRERWHQPGKAEPHLDCAVTLCSTDLFIGSISRPVFKNPVHLEVEPASRMNAVQ
jgi:hypothetical protein